MRYLHRLKDPRPFGGEPPSERELLRWQRERFVIAYDADIDEIDAAWREHVLANLRRYR